MADGEWLGASFTIDISSLRTGLSQANRLIKESKSEFSKASAGLSDWSKNSEVLTAKIKSLNQISEVQQKKVKAITDEYEKLISEGMDPTSARAVNLRTQLNNETAALEKTKAELKEQKEALENLGKESDDTADSIEDVGRRAEQSSGGFTVLKGALANLVADGFRMAVGAAKDFVSEMIEVGKTFDSSMSQVGAVSGASGAELEQLRDKAKEMGSTTKFTASEAADAFNYMAMAGWKTSDMLSGIEGILNLAAASGSDLAETSDIVTDALTAMGYSAGDAGRLADVMAAASSNANTNVQMMGQTFKYAAPLVGALGFTMEDTAVAIGLMANAGIKADKAGTALRSLFTRMSAPPAAAASAMEQLGFSLTDTEGKVKPLATVMTELREKFAKLSETEKTQVAANLAGQEAMSGLLAIVSASPADFDKLTAAVEGSEGAAKRMSDTMLDNLGGDMTILQSQIEGVQLTLNESLQPTLREGVKWLQDFISSVDWQDVAEQARGYIEDFAGDIKDLAKSVLPVAGKALGFLASNFGTLVKVGGTALIVFKGIKAAMAISTAVTAAKTAISGLSAGVGIATKAQTLWNAAMSANPIGAVITAVALLAGGIALLTSNLGKAKTAEEKRLEQSEKTLEKAKEEAEAFDDLKEAQKEQAEKELVPIENAQRLREELEKLADETGYVKDKDKERAEFILGQLNDALGTEYTMTGNVINNYKDLQDEIDKTIEKKKANILLDAMEPLYSEALQNNSQALRDMAKYQDDVAESERILEEAQKKVDELAETAKASPRDSVAQARLRSAVDARDKAAEALKTAQANYNNTAARWKDYLGLIKDYEDASGKIIAGHTDEAIKILNARNDALAGADQQLAKDTRTRLAQLREQYLQADAELEILVDSMTNGVKGVTQAMIDDAREKRNTLYEEYRNLGQSMIDGEMDGIKSKVDAAVRVATDAANATLSAVKNTLKIHSPSARFRDEVGKMIPAGVAEGVDRGTVTVLSSIRRQVKEMQDAYSETDVLGSVGAGIQSRPVGSVNRPSYEQDGEGGSKSRPVVINQTNHYAQAHSRYELYKSKKETEAAVRLALITQGDAV